MPRPQYRSRTFRRVYVKTPGGEVHLHYRRRKPGKAVCSNCRKVLAGVPQALPLKMQNLSKSSKRPERPYGGVLCSACTRKLLQSNVRRSA